MLHDWPSCIWRKSPRLWIWGKKPKNLKVILDMRAGGRFAQVRPYSRAMNKQQYIDAYWTSRFAPYGFTLAAVGFVASLFWLQPRFVFLLVALVSGSLLFVFNVLRWRTGKQVFQILAMASALISGFFIISRHQSLVADMQYMAAFVASYTILVSVFRGRILRGLSHDS